MRFDPALTQVRHVQAADRLFARNRKPFRRRQPRPRCAPVFAFLSVSRCLSLSLVLPLTLCLYLYIYIHIYIYIYTYVYIYMYIYNVYVYIYTYIYTYIYIYVYLHRQPLNSKDARPNSGLNLITVFRWVLQYAIQEGGMECNDWAEDLVGEDDVPVV